jgi:hypothetical protein
MNPGGGQLQKPFYGLMIRSTTAMDACNKDIEELRAPGPDLLSVTLWSDEELVFAHPSLLYHKPGTARSDYYNPGVTAQPLQEAEQACASGTPHPMGMFSMGCDDAWVLYNLFDPEVGQPKPLNGFRVRILEYGAQCADGTDADTFDVYVCDGNEQEDEPDKCTFLLGSGSGDLTLEIPRDAF